MFRSCVILLLFVGAALGVVFRRATCRKEEIVARVTEFLSKNPDDHWLLVFECYPNGRPRLWPHPWRQPLVDWLNEHAAQIHGHNLTFDRRRGDLVCTGDTMGEATDIRVRPNYAASCYPWERLFKGLYCYDKNDVVWKYRHAEHKRP